jgi:hypothetical protein
MRRTILAIILATTLTAPLHAKDFRVQRHCVGTVTHGLDYYLAPRYGQAQYCDAEFYQNARKILRVCPVSSIYEIKGEVTGHGAFVWRTVRSVKLEPLE